MIDYQYASLYLQFDQKTVLIDHEDPSRFVHEDSGKLILIDEDDVELEIGTFITKRIDLISAMNEGESFFDVFDSSTSTISYYEYLYDDRDVDFKPKVYKYTSAETGWSPNLLIIDRIIIYKEYRGHGYASVAIQGLIKTLGMGINFIALKPFPLQFEGQYLDAMNSKDFLQLGFDKLEKKRKKSN